MEIDCCSCCSWSEITTQGTESSACGIGQTDLWEQVSLLEKITKGPRSLCRVRGGNIVVLENTPRHDHAANPAERAIRSVEDQVRVLRLDVEARYGIQVSANMSLWPWIARHAGWLLTRCKIKGNGCTPYQDAYGTKYSGEMMNIAETVLFRFPYPEHRRISGKRTLHKCNSVWERGIWCGRSEDTGEHILLTTDGRVLARTVRRLPVGSGTDIALLRESL